MSVPNMAQQWEQINQPERKLSRPPLRPAVPPSPGAYELYLLKRVVDAPAKLWQNEEEEQTALIINVECRTIFTLAIR